MNQITKLVAGSFKGLHALKKLILFENQLAELPANTFEVLPCLEEHSLEALGGGTPKSDRECSAAYRGLCGSVALALKPNANWANTY